MSHNFISPTQFINELKSNRVYNHREEINGFDTFVYRKYKVGGDIIFNSNNQHHGSILFEDCIFKSIKFLQERFNSLKFQNCVIEENVCFKNVTFKSTLEIIDTKVSDSIIIEGGNYEGEFNIGLERYNGKEPTNIIIKNGIFNKLDIGKYGNTHINDLSLHCNNISGTIFITNENTKVNNLNISHLSRDMMLFLENIHVNSISISSFHSSNRFKIQCVRAFPIQNKESEFKIQNSDFGSAGFSSVDLSEFDVVNIRDSYLSDTNFVNVIWPKDIYSFEQNGNVLEKHINANGTVNCKKINCKKYYRKNRDVYRQLKYASNKFGDTITAYDFLAKELKTYRRYLHSSRNLKKRKERWYRRSELWNLAINEASSYHGTNWIQAVLVTLLLTWTSFTIYCWLIGYRFGSDWGKFWELFSYSFEFLNPIRRHATLADEHTIPPLARIVDYLSRILIAYMVYQTVAAFRKFGKRSS